MVLTLAASGLSLTLAFAPPQTTSTPAAAGTSAEAAGPTPTEGGASGPYRTVVESRTDDDDLEAQRTLDARTPGFATVIDLDAEPVTTAGDDLPTVLSPGPGRDGSIRRRARAILLGIAARELGSAGRGVPRRRPARVEHVRDRRSRRPTPRRPRAESRSTAGTCRSCSAAPRSAGRSTSSVASIAGPHACAPRRASARSWPARPGSRTPTSCAEGPASASASATPGPAETSCTSTTPGPR